MPDFGCYCWVDASLTNGLKLVAKDAEHGFWAKEPPFWMEHRWAKWLLRDGVGWNGSEGSVRCKTSDGVEIKFRFACPTGDNDNYATIEATGHGSENYECRVDAYGANTRERLSDEPLSPQITGDAAKRTHPYCAVFYVVDKRLRKS